MNRKKKILALGYIPKWKGGLQKTGLATGLFDLHDSVNALNDEYEIIIAATDIFQKEFQIDHTRIVGWTKIALLMHSLKRFYRLPKFLMGGLFFLKYLPLNDSIGMFMKLIFLDYAIEKESPTIIHLHGCIYGLCRRYIWRDDIPVVLRIHGINGFDSTIKRYREYRIMEQKLTSLKFCFVTFVTGAICNEWREKYGFFQCKMIPIINGYNPQLFFCTSEDIIPQYDIVTISGLSERKGQGRVLEAMKILKDEGLILKYAVVGDGPSSFFKSLVDYSSENELDVDFYDYCSQNKMNYYLWRSRFFILPSASEGFGKVFIESLAAGIPVILPKNLPIVAEKGLFSSVNSILMEDSSVESIVNALRSVKSFRRNNLEISNSVNAFKWESVSRMYIDLYKNINDKI